MKLKKVKIIEVREELLKLQDKKYQEFSLKLCPDTNKKILGIRIPKLRELAKKIVIEENWKEVIKNLSNECFEETIIKGFIIAYAKINVEEKIEYIKDFVPQMDSWEITDTFVPTLKIKEKDLQMFWDFIVSYTNSEKEFEVRFAIICMLDYYLKEEYLDKVIFILDKIKHEGYYVKMAIAWTFAEIGIKFNEKAMKYLISENNLDKFTYNKTLQKMIESYRISLEQKEILKKMKRK